MSHIRWCITCISASATGVNQIGMYFDYLNLTQLFYNATSNGFYDVPGYAGVTYSTNSSSSQSYQFWELSWIANNFLPIWATLILPVNVTTSNVDLNFWGNVMTNTNCGIPQFSTYGTGLNLPNIR